MSSPNTVQDRRRDSVGGRQSGGHYRGGDDEGDDAQPLGFENLAGERVFELRRQSAPCLALNEIADKGLHGVRQSLFRSERPRRWRYSVPARPACATTLPQRAISAPMKRSSSSGEETLLGIMPRLTICR